jgi:pyruvate/2-oxoglutarate/acetoin dehydrogenase E1 component
MYVVEDNFEYLDSPVERTAGADEPMPYAVNLERMAVSQVHTDPFAFIYNLC